MTSLRFTTIRKKITKVYSTNTWLVNLLKSLAISGLILYLFYVLLSNHPCCRTSKLFATHKWLNSNAIFSLSEERGTTDLSHVVFGIAGSSNTWNTKRAYIESWWRPNVTRGYLFLDRPPTMFLPWAPSSPPFRISENTSRFKEYDKHAMPFAIRMVRVISETFREERENVRWYVMADDDTVLFIDNLVEVLRKYDHTKHYYVGSNSECVASNADHSFQMAFGGAGYALSYPLAEAVAKNLDECLMRYPALFGSDHILQSCIADLGVSLTYERGFHQAGSRRECCDITHATGTNVTEVQFRGCLKNELTG
ncbi:Protein of unknown function DUF604 [Dillenia turbinata]|uniref:Uncharacterized protein n=1 Tax=Dillenia turbinata TaxID=194707 RepID=A0AAN8VG65_9MAGN